MPSSTSNPVDSTPDRGAARFWPVNVALFVGWLTALALLGYAVGGDVESLRWLALGIVMAAASVFTAVSFVRTFRPRRITDAAAIYEGSAAAYTDERQIALHQRARAVAGIAAVALCALSGLAASAVAGIAHVALATDTDWAVMALAFPCVLLLTYNVCLYVASRYYSQKG